MPTVLRDALLRHRSVFADALSADQKIKCDALHMQVREGAELPPKWRRAYMTHHH